MALKYDTKWYYNPGITEVISALLSVFKKVVDNYDIDADSL